MAILPRFSGFSFRGISLFKFLSVLFSFAILGLAHADVQDAPIPTEPNYVGIIIFLVLSVGGTIWFIWSRMRKKDDDDKK
jgi:hypothetical protein